MPLPFLEPGLVICYAYLWNAEFENGREDGVKDRPCAVVLTTLNQEGDILVTVVPITHTPPDRPDEAVEIPFDTKQRLGLDSERSWVIVSEVNRFLWPGPDLRPVSRSDVSRFDYGLLPPALFRQIREKLGACARARRLTAVERTA